MKIKAEDGPTYTRFRTLYKTPQSLDFFYGQIDGELKFHNSFMLEADTLRQQSRMVNDGNIPLAL